LTPKVFPVLKIFNLTFFCNFSIILGMTHTEALRSVGRDIKVRRRRGLPHAQVNAEAGALWIGRGGGVSTKEEQDGDWKRAEVKVAALRVVDDFHHQRHLRRRRTTATATATK
jgi:hypothetical protein